VFVSYPEKEAFRFRSLPKHRFSLERMAGAVLMLCYFLFGNSPILFVSHACLFADGYTGDYGGPRLLSL